MKIKVSKFHVEPNPSNEVTSEKVFKPRRCKDKDGNWRFHDEGIFSKKIFGKLYKCSCGKNKEVGTWCDECGDRVVSKDKMPDFYIDCAVLAPFAHADYTGFGKLGKEIRNLMEFRSFIYDGEVVLFDLEKLDLSKYSDNSKIKIGSEAAKEYSSLVTDEWISKNCSPYLPIPHPIYRRIIQTNTGGHILGPMNDIIVDLLDKRAKILSFKTDSGEDKFQELALSSLLYQRYIEVVEKIFEVLVSGKKSVLNQEVLAQPLTGAFRAVITNNDSLDEDTILIGKELVSTIFPNIHKKYDGDIDQINEHLEREEYHVLVNRPPTIGEKSMIAMKPVVNHDDRARFVVSTNSIIYDGMAADTDGDVFLTIGIYTKEANEEAKQMLPSNNYIGGSNGRIRNKMPEDFEYAMSQIYKNDPEVRAMIKSIIAESLPERYKQGSIKTKQNA